MTTKQIDYVLETAKTLNFNRAAENLFVSQPTLSYQIKLMEEEIGFAIFERQAKTVRLTPAGRYFTGLLRNIRAELKTAVEQAQNYSLQYSRLVNIALPMRQSVYFLPQAIKIMSSKHPDVAVTPHFTGLYDMDKFLSGQRDIIFAMEHQVKNMADIDIYPLFESRIYLIVSNDDPLAKKEKVTTQDLQGRTLMVGGGSPPQLIRVQNKVINTLHIKNFNSTDHDTTLTNVAAGRGVCLAPGFLNDHSGRFSWVPFDCKETVPCVLCTHKGDKNEYTQEFIKIIQDYYKENPDFNL